jgi:hypothetical protein
VGATPWRFKSSHPHLSLPAGCERAVKEAGPHSVHERLLKALQFGHRHGGVLVRKLYGDPDAALARERVREGFRQAPTAPIPLAATAS